MSCLSLLDIFSFADIVGKMLDTDKKDAQARVKCQKSESGKRDNDDHVRCDDDARLSRRVNFNDRRRGALRTKLYAQDGLTSTSSDLRTTHIRDCSQPTKIALY
jgi:hypothetical protein